MLTTSDVARAADVNPETLRYYERRGLLPEPPRSAAGYRRYDAEAVRRLRFIKRAQELGFTLVEIGELLALRADPRADRAAVKAHALAKLADVEARLRDLARMRETLAHLADACDGHGSLDACPILNALDADDHA